MGEVDAKLKVTQYVYVLELEDSYYYVGYTRELDKRINNHKSGNGSEWTKLHKVVKVLKIFENKDKKFEELLTKYMMKKYGIDKVRGGAYTRVDGEFKYPVSYYEIYKLSSHYFDNL